MNIKINNFNWEIIFVDKIDDKDSSGEADFPTQTIKIKNTLHKERQTFVLFHEIKHIYNEYYGIYFTTNEEEESECDMFASLITDLLEHKINYILEEIKWKNI